jgi:ATP-dependent HslUV protease ATP-binding subunit HslU
MAISEPVKEGCEATPPRLDELTPRQIVEELDKYVVGQRRAKRIVAVALRNRVRRQRLDPEMAEEVQPKNIIMIGSTGVGKTEIARRLARLANSPFIKVEASKFTEIGYVGRDVDSIIRDLIDIAVDMVREEKAAQIEEKAEKNAEERLLDLLMPPLKKSKRALSAEAKQSQTQKVKEFGELRENLRQQLRHGELDQKQIELEVPDRSFPSFEIFSSQGFEEMDVNFKDFFPGMGPRTRKRKMRVEEAIDYLIVEEESKLIDMDQVTREALERAEESGIVFLDEIDKIAGRESGHGPEISREGVQRDILPIVEGTTISTRYGMVRTDHILFIAAGAFHVSKPADLIPELQGRFPVRVEMDALTVDDFVRILREPKNALIKQYTALLHTEGVQLKFTDDAIREIAHFAALVNETTENIGARRLHTIMEALLEEISFAGAETPKKRIVIDSDYVQDQLGEIVQNQDLSRYIL